MKLYKTCLFVFCVMMILLLLSFVFPQPSVSFLGLTLRWPSVVEVLESKEETKIDVDKQLDLV
jgi:type II secretory pathway component PulF